MTQKYMALIATLVGFGAYVAEPTVPEPEFINSQVHLTIDSTYQVLPKEHGQFKIHESKLSKLSKIGNAALAEYIPVATFSVR